MSKVSQEFKIPIPWVRIFGTMVSLITLVLLYMLPESGQLARFAIFMLGAIAGGWFFYVETVEAIFEKRKITIDVLMTLAIVGAASLGALEESLTIVFLYSITETLEGYTVKRTRTTIKSLMTLVPKTATKLIDGNEKVVPVEDLVPGDVVLLRPGDYIPIDGIVLEGRGTVDEAAITGESVPVLKSQNDAVFAGTICQDSVLKVQVEKPVSESTVARIISLVEDAQKRKVPSQLLIEKFTRYYNPFVIVFALILFVGSLLFSRGFDTAAVLSITFVVAAAPCALAIATPVSVYASVGTAAKKGILVKGGAHLQGLGEVTAIAFDKTGTLTMGTSIVTDVVGVTGVEKKQVMKYAASLERLVRHPLAKAVLRKAEEMGIQTSPVENFKVIPGEGVEGVIEGEKWWLGSYEIAKSRKILKNEFSELSSSKTLAILTKNGDPYGTLAFEDEIRPEARLAIKELEDRGIQVFMLTGDRKSPALRVAGQLGIPENHVFYELSPENKAGIISELKEKNKLAMVGDGINDAPALALADVGIAMGVAGTDVALETANVAIMSDEIHNIALAVDIGKRMKKIIFQNLVTSGIILFLLITGVLIGNVNLISAILVHEVSEALIVGNSLRLLSRLN